MFVILARNNRRKHWLLRYDMTAHGVSIVIDRRHGDRRRGGNTPAVERRSYDRRVQRIDDRLRNYGWALVDAKGYHVEVFATGLQGAWDAVVRISRAPADAQLHLELVRFGEPTPDLAEQRAVIWAKRWVDVNGPASSP